MSGGSFDYLCNKDVEVLVNDADVLVEMTDWLRDNYPESSAYGATCKVGGRLAAIRDLMSTLEYDNELFCAIREVWRSVEWCESGDTERDDVDKAIFQYEETFGDFIPNVPKGDLT